MTAKREFLVCYDYGTGGLWGIMNAHSKEEIAAVYPELDVADDLPPFLTPADVERMRDNEWHDIDGAPWGILNALLADRRKQEGGPCEGC